MRAISQSVNPYFERPPGNHGENRVAFDIMDYLWKKECSGASDYIDLFEVLSERNEGAFEEWNHFLRENCESFYSQKRHVKCNIRASVLLQHGHHKLEAENWSGAMESFNQSLCFAETGGETQSLAYANRSACFYHMELYGKALSDIAMALKTNKIARGTAIWQQIEHRRQECIRRMQELEFDPSSPLPKLSYSADKNFPCMADALEIRENDQFGRYIVAKRDIAVGKIVLVSKVFTSGTVSESRYCHVCNKTEQNLVACARCSNTMFCTGTCSEQQNVHRLECQSIFHTIEDSTMKLAVQTILMAIDMFPDVCSLIRFVEDTIKDYALPKSARNPKSRYGLFLKLFPFLDEERVLPAYQVYTILLSIPKVRQLFNSNRKKQFLMHLTLHHVTVIPQNAFRHERFKRDWIKTDYIYDIMSLINHSCTPNLFNHSISDDIGYCMAIRPIRQGEQVFINYLGNQSVENRQAALKTWNFECKCIRCQPTHNPSYIHRQHTKMRASPSLQYITNNCQKGKCKANNNESGSRKKLKDECRKFLQEFGYLIWTPEIYFVTHCYTLH